MSWPPRTVVVGVDGSDRSVRAAEVATEIVRQGEGRLVIVTVVRPPEGWWGVVGSPPPAETMAGALADAQRTVLDATAGALDLEGIEWETVEELGDPAASLLNVCDGFDADVLVVGRRGAGLLERMVLGSVADRVVRHSACPVIVVP